MDKWKVGLLAGLISLVMAIAVHYFPWRALLGRDLPRLAAYSLGLFVIVAPLTIVILLVPDNSGAIWVAAVWFSGFCAGAGTLGSHALDNWLRTRARLAAEHRENRVLRGGIEAEDAEEKQ